MAFSIDPSGKHFRHCAFKSFPYQLTSIHCTPSPGYTNEIHIFTPAGGGGGGGDGAFKIDGWEGYNSRFNGEYTPTGESRDGRPVFRHTHSHGVGAGHDW